MTLSVTLAVMAVAALIFAWSNWRVRHAVMGEPSLVPHGPIQLLCVLALVLMAAHLVSLLTGQPFTGRLMGGR